MVQWLEHRYGLRIFMVLKTRLSTLWTDDVTCGSDFTRNSMPGLSTIEGHERTTGEAGIATTGVSVMCFEYNTIQNNMQHC